MCFFVLFCALVFVLWSVFCSVGLCCLLLCDVLCCSFYVFCALCVCACVFFFTLFVFCCVVDIVLYCVVLCCSYAVLFVMLRVVFFFTDELVLPLRLLCWQLGCVVADVS